MSMKRLACACLAGAVVCLAASRAAAHPPDLPVDTKDICVPCPDGECYELNTRKPCDPTSPMLSEILSRFVQSFTAGFGGVPVLDLDLEFFCSTDDSPVASSKAVVAETVDAVRRAHARKIYLIGERCRRTGDLDMAENCYQETKLLCPGCDYARKAERRIKQVRARRASEREDIGEEAEPAKEEAPKEKGNYDYEVPPTSGPILSNNLELSFSARISRVEYMGMLPERMRGEKLVFETDFAKLAEAKALYYVGERCRRGGDLKMAYRCYEDACRVCPQCRHGKKAQMRMRQIESRVREEGQKPHELGQTFVSGEFLGVGAPSPRPEPPKFYLGMFDDSRHDERPPLPPTVNIEIVEEESRPMLEGDAEESDYPLTPSSQSEPSTLYIAPAARDLRLSEEQEEKARNTDAPSCEDLSDWLPQAIRLMRGAGSLRIEASRLGRLMGRGESAVRALGCSIKHECGRSYVIYPAEKRRDTSPVFFMSSFK